MERFDKKLERSEQGGGENLKERILREIQQNMPYLIIIQVFNVSSSITLNHIVPKDKIS